MKNKTLKLCLAVALLALPAFALAADPTPRPTPIRKATVNGSTFDGSSAGTISGGGDYTATFSYSVAGGAMALNDTLGLAKLPKGAVITDWYLYMPAQGTAAVHSLGIQETPALLLTTSTVGAAAAAAAPSNAANGLTVNAVPSAVLGSDTYLMLTTTTAATTPNATVAVIKGWVRYHMHQSGAF